MTKRVQTKGKGAVRRASFIKRAPTGRQPKTGVTSLLDRLLHGGLLTRKGRHENRPKPTHKFVKRPPRTFGRNKRSRR